MGTSVSVGESLRASPTRSALRGNNPAVKLEASWAWPCRIQETPVISKWKWTSLSHVWLFATLWTLARQAPLSTGFPGQWVAISSTRASSQPRVPTRSLLHWGQILYCPQNRPLVPKRLGTTAALGGFFRDVLKIHDWFVERKYLQLFHLGNKIMEVFFFPPLCFTYWFLSWGIK